MKRTAVTLLGLGLALSMALLAGCTAAPTTDVGVTAIGPGTGSASRFDTSFRLGAGDALGAIIFAGGDTGRPRHLDEDTSYATVDDDDRPSR